MGQFICDFCGKCCSSFGSFITIERQLNDRYYYCRYSLNGNLYPVHADREYSEEVSDRYMSAPGNPAAEGKKSCPFLCKSHGRKGFTCAIYESRPPVCREFRCYRMLVYDNNGTLSGKVIGAGEISTSDAALARLWKEQISILSPVHPPSGNDPAWVRSVTGILAAHGYRGDAVQ